MNRTAIRFTARTLGVALLLVGCTPKPDAPAAEGAAQDPSTPDSDVRGSEPPPPHDDTAELTWVRANACPDQSPISLTASDGTGLTLKALKARAAIEGPVALTELHLSFDNPEDRVLEGRFAITLPPGAAISRFAMKIGGRWQEGEVVERQKARRVYEDFLHRRQDPALLENDAGNVFRARVFPIPAKARKDIVIAYSQTMAAEGEPYRLPLCGLPKLGELDVDVAIVRGAAHTPSSLGGASTSVQHLAVREQDFAPDRDLEAWTGKGRVAGIRHGDLAIARVVPQLDVPPLPITELTVLFDSSASRALDFKGQVDRLSQLVGALATAEPGLQVRIVAFDQEVLEVYEGKATDLSQDALDRLVERGAMGASDLAGAIEALGKRGLASKRVLLVGDGVATAGDTEAGPLQEALRALSEDGVTRFDALVDGGIQDATMLAQLTKAGLPEDGVVLDARLERKAIVEKLGKATRSGITVEVPGAEWVWPKRIDGVQPGDSVLVYAQLPPQAALEVRLDGAKVAEPTPTLSQVPGPLLARAFAEARIAGMEAELSALPTDSEAAKAERRELKDRIVEVSTQHRVLSKFTALLVLETEDDYRRYDIDRNALADILGVGPSGVTLLPRAEVNDPQAIEEPPSRWEDRDDDEKSKDKGGAKKKSASARGGEDGSVDDLLDEAPDPEMPAETKAEADDDFGGNGQRHRGEEGRMGRPSDAPPPPAAVPEPMEDPEAEELPGDGLGLIGRGSGGGGRADRREARPRPRRRPPHGGMGHRPPPPPPPPKERPKEANPWDGRFAEVMKKVAAGDHEGARDEAAAWRKDNPGDVLALVALGEAYEAAGKSRNAARAYGSLIDLFPSRADLRRMAGERLERLGDDTLALTVDTYRKALESRPDQPSGARLLAYALLKQGKHEEAFEVIVAALGRSYPSGRFAEIGRILREDLGLVGAAWIAADGSVDKKVRAALSKHGATLDTEASTRFVLTWETDANDVDLHVYDASGGHAYYSNRSLPSGGQLYADVTTGYGPECFTIRGKPSAGPYVLQAHYYRRGPMGYGMGKLQVLQHDGRGGLVIDDEPFLIMRDDAWSDLAKVDGKVTGTTIGLGKETGASTTPVKPTKVPGMVPLE